MKFNCVSDCAQMEYERVKLIDPKGLIWTRNFAVVNFALFEARDDSKNCWAVNWKQQERVKVIFFLSFFWRATISSNCCPKLLCCFKVQFIKNIYLINHCRTSPNKRVTFSDVNSALLILTQNWLQLVRWQKLSPPVPCLFVAHQFVAALRRRVKFYPFRD